MDMLQGLQRTTASLDIIFFAFCNAVRETSIPNTINPCFSKIAASRPRPAAMSRAIPDFGKRVR